MDGLHENASVASANEEYTEFLEDLEEDPEMRKNVNVYKDKRKMETRMDDGEPEQEIPQIDLAEMLDDLVLGGASSAEVKEVPQSM